MSVKSIAIPCSSAAAITSSSRMEPPGWITQVTPAAAAASIPSRNGKNASEAIEEPFTSRPSSAALIPAIFAEYDFGTKSIGVAVGQRITGTARPLPAIKAQDGTPDWNIIERLLKEWQPDEIIVGLPLNMDGTEQPLTARARKFANRIHGRFGVEVKLHDERLSTVEARSGLFEQGGYRALNKGKVDSASAVIILESYFEQGY